MLDFLKRLVAAPAKETVERPRRKQSRPRRPAPDLSEPIPLPQVTEGNDHTDWDLWQDSVDSQAMPLSRSSSSFADTTPSQLDNIDPFARVHKNRDV